VLPSLEVSTRNNIAAGPLSAGWLRPGQAAVSIALHGVTVMYVVNAFCMGTTLELCAAACVCCIVCAVVIDCRLGARAEHPSGLCITAVCAKLGCLRDLTICSLLTTHLRWMACHNRCWMVSCLDLHGLVWFLRRMSEACISDKHDVLRCVLWPRHCTMAISCHCGLVTAARLVLHHLLLSEGVFCF
jgi:hypothetical protein